MEEEEEEEEKNSQDWRKSIKVQRGPLSVYFFRFVTGGYFVFCDRILYSEKGSVAPQSENKFVVFLSCLL